MSPEVQRGLTNVVAEAGKLFGARHYREYHFLLTPERSYAALRHRTSRIQR
jgi:predicted metalloprotease with PDZ domain